MNNNGKIFIIVKAERWQHGGLSYYSHYTCVCLKLFIMKQILTSPLGTSGYSPKSPGWRSRSFRTCPCPIFPAPLLTLTMLQPLLAPSSLPQPYFCQRVSFLQNMFSLHSYLENVSSSLGNQTQMTPGLGYGIPSQAWPSLLICGEGVGGEDAYALCLPGRDTEQILHRFGRDQKVLVNKAGATFT